MPPVRAVSLLAVLVLLVCLGPVDAPAQGTLTTPQSRVWRAAVLADDLLEQPDDLAPPNQRNDAERALDNSAVLRRAFKVSGIETFLQWDQVSAPLDLDVPSAAPELADPGLGNDPGADDPDETNDESDELPGPDPDNDRADRQLLDDRAEDAYRAAIPDGRIASTGNRNIPDLNFFGLDRRDNPYRWPATEVSAGELLLTWQSRAEMSAAFRYRVFITRVLWNDGMELAWDDLVFLAQLGPDEVDRTGDARQESFAVTIPQRSARAALVVVREDRVGEARAFVAVADLQFSPAEGISRGVDARQGRDQRANGDNRGGGFDPIDPTDPSDENFDGDGQPDLGDGNDPSGEEGDGSDEPPIAENFRFITISDDDNSYSGALALVVGGTRAITDPTISFVIASGEVEALGFGPLERGRGGSYEVRVLGTFPPGEEISLQLSVTGVDASDPRGPSEAAVVNAFSG